MLRTILLACAALLALPAGRAAAQQTKELRAVGVTVGSLGNPFFVALGKGATDAARAINPQARVTVASAVAVTSPVAGSSTDTATTSPTSASVGMPRASSPGRSGRVPSVTRCQRSSGSAATLPTCR